MFETPTLDAKRATEVIFGETVRVFDRKDGFALVQTERDLYVGWVPETALETALQTKQGATTHTVRSIRTHAYTAPDLKLAEQLTLPQGSKCHVTVADGDWRHVEGAGWVHDRHLLPVGERTGDDPASVAERYRGAPYLWGGRTSLGLDCTGLTQTAFEACGTTLPRDSDMQFGWIGDDIENWQKSGRLRRNDLVFWKGHVGIMLDAETLCHANAWHMATAIEPLAVAIERIKSYYAEPIGARRIDFMSLQGQTPQWKRDQSASA